MKKLMYGLLWIYLLSANATALSTKFPYTHFFPQGADANRTFFVTNTDNAVAAVEISVKTREHGLRGEETNKPADDEFVIFPSQVILQPGEEKVITMIYVGDTTLTTEKAYRVVIEQLPINVYSKQQKDGSTNTIAVITKISKSIYVTPAGAKPELAMTKVELLDDGNVGVVVKNTGTAHRLIEKGTVTFLDASGNRMQNVELTVEALGNGRNILAGEERQLIISKPEMIHLETSKIQIQFDD